MLQSMLDMDTRFIMEAITVEWDEPPFLQKKPICPDRFVWREERYKIEENMAEWRDYQRRGRMGKNMRPARLYRARQRGSWGVGRFYYRVRVTDGRIFELYYDRAAQGSDERKGSWFLTRELL